MGNDLTTTEGTEGNQPSAAEMFTSIMELVKDPAVSVDKMDALLQMQERMIDRQALMDFNKARMQAMIEMPVIDRNGQIINHKTKDVQSRFARFEDIDRIVRPICQKHGLAYSFNPGTEDGKITVTCELAHVGGHVKPYGPLPLAVDTTGSKNATQGAGSALSYGKRYTLCAALNIITVGEDNDANTKPGFELVDWQDEVRDAAQKAAAQGSAAYAAFYNTLSPMRKGWLFEEGGHSDLKAAAAEHGA